MTDRMYSDSCLLVPTHGLDCFSARNHNSCSLITCLNTWWCVLLGFVANIHFRLTGKSHINQSGLTAAASWWHNAWCMNQSIYLAQTEAQLMSLNVVGYNKHSLECSLVPRLLSTNLRGSGNEDNSSEGSLVSRLQLFVTVCSQLEKITRTNPVFTGWMRYCNCRDISIVYSLNSRKSPGCFSYGLGMRLSLP